MVKRRHVPLRTCVSCGLKTAKRDLLRVVSSADGTVGLDATGRLNGRGAYVCDRCRNEPGSLKRGRLEHSLRTSIDDVNWGILIGELHSGQGGANAT